MWKGGSRGGGAVAPLVGDQGAKPPGRGFRGAQLPGNKKIKKNYNFVFLCYFGEHYLASRFQVRH